MSAQTHGQLSHVLGLARHLARHVLVSSDAVLAHFSKLYNAVLSKYLIQSEKKGLHDREPLSATTAHITMQLYTMDGRRSDSGRRL